MTLVNQRTTFNVWICVTFTNLPLEQVKGWKPHGAAQQSPPKLFLTTGFKWSILWGECHFQIMTNTGVFATEQYTWCKHNFISISCYPQDELFSALLGPQAKPSRQVNRKRIYNITIPEYMDQNFWEFLCIKSFLLNQILHFLSSLNNIPEKYRKVLIHAHWRFLAHKKKQELII